MTKVLSIFRKSDAKAPRRKSISLDRKKARAGWIFVLPFVIGFVLIYIPMIAESLIYTFTDVTATSLKDGIFSIKAVGFDNYQEVLFNHTDFVERLVSGTTQLIIDIPAIIIFSLFMAVMLNQKMIGRAAFRAIFFIPVIVTTGIIAKTDLATQSTTSEMEGGMESGNEAQQSGGVSQIVSAADFGALFSNMKVGGELQAYVVDIINNIFNIVNRSGVQLLIFLAGLQSISPAIYESCSIDGASAWETFWKITFPMISPMILVNAVYTVIDSFTAASNSVMSFIQDVLAGNSANYKASYGVTMAWVYFLIVIVIVAVVAGILSTYIFYQRKET
ncbi:MAG: sugar ABC transporter permease [Clostridia bacterium]|nr:sugar ABC transporter permease [Clostridia bacterium]